MGLQTLVNRVAKLEARRPPKLRVRIEGGLANWQTMEPAVLVTPATKSSQTYLKFQLPHAACSNFCVGYPRMALVPPVLRST
jgi:hypothetical protein